MILLMRKDIDTILTIIGIVLAILGWFFDHSQELGWVNNLISPSYAKATFAYETILSKDKILSSSDKGFTEILQIVQEFAEPYRDSSISGIRIVDRGFSFLGSSKNSEATPGILVQIKYGPNRADTSIFMKDFPPILKDKYLDFKLFTYGASIFWLGICLSCFGIIIKLRKPRAAAA